MLRVVPQPQNSSSPAEPSLTVGGNGTGTAIISPAVMNAHQHHHSQISIAGDGTNTLDSVIVIVPSGWLWTGRTSSVSLSGSGAAGATVAVSADTIFVGKGAITNTDTGKITIASVTAPDSSVTSPFIIKTGLNGGTPVQIASTVSVTVLKLVFTLLTFISTMRKECLRRRIRLERRLRFPELSPRISTRRKQIFLCRTPPAAYAFTVSSVHLIIKLGTVSPLPERSRNFAAWSKFLSTRQNMLCYSSGNPLPESAAS